MQSQMELNGRLCLKLYVLVLVPIFASPKGYGGNPYRYGKIITNKFRKRCLLLYNSKQNLGKIFRDFQVFLLLYI